MAKYKCKECDRVFGRKQGLAVHRGVKHPAKDEWIPTAEQVAAAFNEIDIDELGEMVSPTFNEILPYGTAYVFETTVDVYAIIRQSLTKDEWRGYLKGQVIGSTISGLLDNAAIHIASLKELEDGTR